MNEVQQASAYFWIPLIGAYVAALLGWMALVRWRPGLWPAERTTRSDRPWLDFALVFLAAAGILGIGALHRQGWLLPQPPGPLGTVMWNLNVLLIYSPILVTVLARRQGLETLYLSPRRWPIKFGVGSALGLLGVAVFFVARGQAPTLVVWGRDVVDPARLAKYFLPVFLEGVALAFVFVRLRWAMGLGPALVIPALLFALAHVPNSLAEGRSAGYIATFLILNSGLVVLILYVVQRSRDVLWLGMVHYMMDVAIEAF